LLLIPAFALVAVIGRAVAGGDDMGWDSDAAAFDRSDVENAEHLLASVSGANDVLCAAVGRAFHNGYWSESILESVDVTISAEAAETARWIGKRRIDPAALEVARRGLASDDACVRRTASQIAGHLDIRRLDEALRSELAAASPTRLAAVMALGYAEQPGSMPVFERLLRDDERAVRLAALWGIGKLEDPAATPLLARLLESDPDAEVRRIAAWALGQLD
jgi:hypothetical protein